MAQLTMKPEHMIARVAEALAGSIPDAELLAALNVTGDQAVAMGRGTADDTDEEAMANWRVQAWDQIERALNITLTNIYNRRSRDYVLALHALLFCAWTGPTFQRIAAVVKDWDNLAEELGPCLYPFRVGGVAHTGTVVTVLPIARGWRPHDQEPDAFERVVEGRHEEPGHYVVNLGDGSRPWVMRHDGGALRLGSIELFQMCGPFETFADAAQRANLGYLREIDFGDPSNCPSADVRPRFEHSGEPSPKHTVQIHAGDWSATLKESNE